VSLAQVKPRHWLAMRQCRVHPDIQPLTGTHYRGKQPELTTGTTTFAFNSALRQASFKHRPLNQPRAKGLNFNGDSFEKIGPCFQRSFAVLTKSLQSQAARLLDIFSTGAREVWLQALSSSRVDRFKGGLVALVAGLTNQLMS
tara:strand:- start:400 stop:828 length:429 start_codon:yes stop_codon:yes gene_type:complete